MQGKESLDYVIVISMLVELNFNFNDIFLFSSLNKIAIHEGYDIIACGTMEVIEVHEFSFLFYFSL